MDHKNHDQVFIVNFAKVLGALVAITMVCGLAARMLDTGETHQDPGATKRLEERLKPAGEVVTDAAALVQVAAAAPARAPYSGDQVVAKVCNACHGTGVLGAPKVGDHATWAARAKADGGAEGLAGIAIHGKGSMPPRGGDPSLSDDEVKAAVQQMLKQSGV
ncbi:MAG TPA: c-type cytochrome [Solimonas sp.]|nr:c-type cytochrome [Solimonas sp.]